MFAQHLPLACRVVAKATVDARLRASHYGAAVFACVALGEDWFRGLDLHERSRVQSPLSYS